MTTEQKQAYLHSARQRGAAKVVQTGVGIGSGFGANIIYMAQVEGVLHVSTSIENVRKFFEAATHGNPPDVRKKQWKLIFERLGLLVPPM